MTRTGSQPAPRRARRRAVRRDPPRRRGSAGARAGHAGACRDDARRGLLRVHVERRAAAGHAVRADPLVGREQLRGPHRRAGAAGHRSAFGPARGQGDAGPHRAAAREPLRLRPVAPALATRRARLLGARAHAGRIRDLHRARRAVRRLERLEPAPAAGRRTFSPTRTSARGNTAPPCCAMGGSRRCSTLPRARSCRRSNGSRRCFDLPASAAGRRAVACWPAGRSGARIEGPVVLRLLPGRAQAHRGAPLPMAPTLRRRDRRGDARRHQLRLMRARAQAPRRRLAASLTAAAE